MVDFPWGNILMIPPGEETDWVLFWLSESERKEAPRASVQEIEGSECCLWFTSRTRDGSRSDGSAWPPSSRSSSPSVLVYPPFSDHRLSDGPASQRPELHQSRGFVLRGRPDWALHESIHPLHHRHTLRALPAPRRDRGGTEEEAVAETQSTQRETRSAAQRNVSKRDFFVL